MDLGKRIQKATSQTLTFHLLMEGKPSTSASTYQQS